jgi:hypothetical protein
MKREVVTSYSAPRGRYNRPTNTANAQRQVVVASTISINKEKRNFEYQKQRLVSSRLLPAMHPLLVVAR